MLQQYIRQCIQHSIQRSSSAHSLIKRHASSSSSYVNIAEIEAKLKDIPLSRIRNFSIIAHIDHGKTTLSTKLLELTNVIPRPSEENKQARQFLDYLKVEKERGITVKAQTVSMFYHYDNQTYLINLIDTPGHVDFKAEVSRSLAACEGVVLLVDAAQGVEAQTVANFYLAFERELECIPALNKIDLPHANSERALAQMKDNFDTTPEETLRLSAKAEIGIPSVLEAVITRIKPPSPPIKDKTRCLLIDSWYDQHLGVISLLRIVSGELSAGKSIVSHHSGKKYTIVQVGLMYPLRTPIQTLKTGYVGYVTMGMKESKEAFVGDTFYADGEDSSSVIPLPGFAPVRPMVYVAAFPIDTVDFEKLDVAIGKLILNDRSISVQRENSDTFGQGWRIGFSGTLHLSVFEDRLKEEYGAELIITNPTVPYKITYTDGTVQMVSNPSEFPNASEKQKISETAEPIVMATMITPIEYVGKIISLCEENRGVSEAEEYLSDTQARIKYKIPLSQLLQDFFGKLKSATNGFATLDYEEYGYLGADLVKMNILLNQKPVDSLAIVCVKDAAEGIAKDSCERLRKLIDRHMFDINIQAASGKHVYAKSLIKGNKKDVTAKLYGGDQSRKQKLLDKQKEGKKKMKSIGNISISQEAYQEFLSRK